MDNVNNEQNTTVTPKAIAKGRSVLPLIDIKANDLIRYFSDQIQGRTQLPVLIRRLIHSTCEHLTKVEFPGNDDGERKGPDGVVENLSFNAWVPTGTSVWEFGVNQSVTTKANNDIEKSIKSNFKDEEIKDFSFVFVSPQRWLKKACWEKEQNSKKQWKKVTAFDASNLEEWIEQSLPAQVWFANLMGKDTRGTSTIEMILKEWTETTDPHFPLSLFDPYVTSFKETFEAFLNDSNKDCFVIGADSKDEALTFIAYLFSQPSFAHLSSEVLYFEDKDFLRKAILSDSKIIPVISDPRLATARVHTPGRAKVIVVVSSNEVNPEPDIILEPVPREHFSDCLEKLGFSQQEINQLSIRSGRSLTSLRRGLDTSNLLRPSWLTDEVTRKLIPFALVGSWDRDNKAEVQFLSKLSNRTIEQLDEDFSELRFLEEPPVWTNQNLRGTISKTEPLLFLKGRISVETVNRFYDLVSEIFKQNLNCAEGNPTPPTEHIVISEEFKSELAWMIAFFSVNGAGLFEEFYSFDGMSRAETLFKELLIPLTSERILKLSNQLPLFVEAAPNFFLRLFKDDLNSENSTLKELILSSIDIQFSPGFQLDRLFESIHRLAWQKRYFLEAVMMLAEMADLKEALIEPAVKRLKSILHPWMPQSSSSLQQRMLALKTLMEKHPRVGWEVCVYQFNDTVVGYHQGVPTLRSDDKKAGEPIKNWHEICSQINTAIELALSLESYSEEMLTQLVNSSRGFSDPQRGRLFSILEKELPVLPPNEKEKILLNLRHKIYYISSKKGSKTPEVKKRVEELCSLYKLALPPDPRDQRFRLFADRFVLVSPSKTVDPLADHQRELSELENLRKEAIRETFQEDGARGICDLAEHGPVQDIVGSLLSQEPLDETQLIEIIQEAWNRKSKTSQFLQSFLGCLNEVRLNQALIFAQKELDQNDFLSFLFLSPFRTVTWKFISKLQNDNVRKKYWTLVKPIPIDQEDSKAAVEEFLGVHRPVAALYAIEYVITKTNPLLLVKILDSIDLQELEDRQNYHDYLYMLSEIFKRLNETPFVSKQRKALLELKFVGFLTQPFDEDERQKVPNLLSYLEDHPELFAEMIINFRGEGFSFYDDALNNLNFIPGLNEASINGKSEKLVSWITVARDKCKPVGLSEIADYYLGKLLANSPVDDDGIWPCKTVRNIIEKFDSADLRSGFITGKLRARGCFWVRKGYNEEKEMSQKFKKDALLLKNSHSITASLLEALSEYYKEGAKKRDLETRKMNRSNIA